MADETPDSGFTGDAGATPPAREDVQASSAIGAPAPHDSSVVHVAFGAARGQGGDGSSTDDASGTNPPGPPPPQKSAVAQPEGDGGSPTKSSAKKRKRKPKAAEDDAADGGDEGEDADDVADPRPAPERKKERTIDWGKFNGLVENFALIYGTDTVWDGSERMIMKISNMAHAHGSDMVRLWKGSERRRTVRQSDVVFDPTMQADPDKTVNLFDGFAMEPKQGDVEPALELIRFLTSKSSPHDQEADNIMHWLLCWLAYPLQNPGAKLRTAVVMHGDEGAGKNFLFDMVVAIYGKYGALVGQDELEDKFNDWRSCKLFVVGDEVSSRAELVHNKNRLKALITSPTVQINPKNLPRREESNHMNIVFLSNELQPLALDNSDRRYLVVFTPRAREFEFYKRLGDWRDNGGIEAFYHYLLTYPLDDFAAFAPAPMTEAKTALIGLNRKSPELFWSEWQGAELDLPYMACSVAQLYQAYLRWCVRTGERYPFKREQFTPTVQRFAEAQGKFSQVKPMNVTTLGPKKTVRMYLVAEPSTEIPQGEWASSCVTQFDEHLRTFLGGSRSHGGEDSGKDGGE